MGLLPGEAHARVQQALLGLLELPEAQELLAGPSALAKADCLARFLCGLQLPWDAGCSGGTPSASCSTRKGRVRILLTGCFDLMHAGHYNALRQAKAAFRRDGYDEVQLVAGVHSDAAIAAQKGPPVIPHFERVELVRACKWVDEVAADLPYAVPVRLLDELRCDFAVHGDDLPKLGSGGLFDEVQRAGRLRIVKRTEGMSTTELIGRLMSMSKEHQLKSEASEGLVSSLQCVAPPAGVAAAGGTVRPALLPTVSRLVDFHEQGGGGGAVLAAAVADGHLSSQTKSGDAGSTAARLGARRVVYVPGVWDLFHVGHVRFLEQAARLGDYVLVGALSDAEVNRRIGRNYPLQSLHERSLALLACRHVNDVLLSAPWKVSRDLLTTMNVSVVCHGSTDFWDINFHDQGDPFEVPRELGILRRVESGCTVTVHLLAHRIWQHSEEYAIRQQRKESEERRYMDGKVFVDEA